MTRSAGPQLKVSSDTVTLTWRRGSNSGPLGPLWVQVEYTTPTVLCCCLMFVIVFLGYNQYWSSGFMFFCYFMSRSIRRLAGSLLRKPILVTHIRTVLRTYSRKVLILISTGSWWEARRLDIGLNLHHQALLLLCVCKCEKRRLRRNAF